MSYCPQCAEYERTITLLRTALETARDYVAAEVAEKAIAYGDRLQHKQQALRDDLALVDVALKEAKQ
jgi:hypothetical protein